MASESPSSSAPKNDEQQVWAELSDTVLGHVVSLCTQPRGKRPKHVGTGVLVEVAGRPFLVSPDNTF
jgi:hypothetical protein